MSSSRVWYRSLYSRIAIGYVALIALLLLAQTGLFIWLTNRMWGRATRTPAQLAQLVASDLSEQLVETPDLDLPTYLRRYSTGYQPFFVLLNDGRSGSNRPTAIPASLGREARIAMFRGEHTFDREHEPHPSPRGGEAPIGRSGVIPVRFAEHAFVTVNGSRIGVVAVPSVPPPFTVGLRELAPLLTWVGIGLAFAGAAMTALLIFRPTHRRLRSLEEAARALGEGRSDVRANESGGDEVSALSRTFNHMAAALSQSDRARRQLLADVSHELMTPLSAIRGYIETLGMPELGLDTETRRRYLDIVEQETHKLEAIIGDLLDLAKLEGGADTMADDEVYVGDLFRRVGDRHRPSLCERKITLSTVIDEGTPRIRGDADRLEQAIQNVAANAIRHTPEGGTVALRAQPAGAQVRITVSDTGPGIPPEHLPHIFDRFYKADAARAGTRVPSGSGLGLSIVRAIVMRHGGEVRAMNGEGGGAVFELLLPAAQQT